MGCSASTSAAGFLRGASKYQKSSGRSCQIWVLAASSSPNRKIGLDRPSTRQLGAERGDRVADGRRVAGLGQLDRQEELQRGPPVARAG